MIRIPLDVTLAELLMQGVDPNGDDAVGRLARALARAERAEEEAARLREALRKVAWRLTYRLLNGEKDELARQIRAALEAASRPAAGGER